jgi:superfamily II DNA/RNA helicase
VVSAPVASYNPVLKFTELAVDPRLKQNIVTKGYTIPTPIQDKAIPMIMAGRDVVGLANTGTGKTAAFLVPLINKLVTEPSSRVLIVAPTRELAVQIEDEFRNLARGMQIWSALCIGGVSISGQIHKLRSVPKLVVGTPGRLKDLEQQRFLRFDSFNTIVLDEVDRMLDMGFITDVKYIISGLPTKRHSLFFSATLPDNAKEIIKTLMTSPIYISVQTKPITDNINQSVIKTNGKPKIELLHDLLIQEEFTRVLVFGRTKWGMEKLSKALIERGFKVAAIHGNKTQNQRQKALQLLKDSRIQALLATDVASRGLDIDNVSHVINYDLPETYEDYIHRIGRTGRADKKGVALTFVE